MNTPDSYLRDTERTRAIESPEPTETVSKLGIHGDPSQNRGPSGAVHTGRTMAWIRPSELLAATAAPLIQRASDVQAESIRRARRAPARITRAAIARPAATLQAQDGGLSL